MIALEIRSTGMNFAVTLCAVSKLLKKKLDIIAEYSNMNLLY